MRPVEGGLEGYVLALECVPLTVAGHLLVLLGYAARLVEVRFPASFDLILGGARFLEPGLFQHPPVGHGPVAHSFDHPDIQTLGEIHQLAGGRAAHIGSGHDVVDRAPAADRHGASVQQETLDPSELFAASTADLGLGPDQGGLGLGVLHLGVPVAVLSGSCAPPGRTPAVDVSGRPT